MTVILSGRWAFDLNIGALGVSIPITAQSLAVSVISVLYKRSLGASVIGLYLIMGAFGLPVFAGGSGGVTHLFGNSSGYLFSFLLLPFLFGRSGTYRRTGSLIRSGISMLLCHATILLTGTVVLAFKQNWAIAIDFGLIPFLPGAVIKSLVGAFMVFYLRKIKLWQ
jgi:biotin transport system substrate-specific component